MLPHIERKNGVMGLIKTSLRTYVSEERLSNTFSIVRTLE